MNEKFIEYHEFDTLFNPEHIALVGASESSTFGSMFFLRGFQNSKWSDTFYPINPKRDKILNWKCYPSVLDVPYPIDTVYISVKRAFIPQIMKECVRKKVRWVIAFSSGFSETGDKEGGNVEQELKEIVKGSSTRIIGPNCLGPFNSENGMSFSFAEQEGIPGSISFMSQSGGHLTQLMDVGFKRDIRFRYGVSFGNQTDLNCTHFLRHYRNDNKTKIIAAYLESFGSAYGHDLFLEIKETTSVKPVVIWKGGYTEDGSKAAFSHTGAMVSNEKLWESMARQTGMTLVRDNEEWWNTLKTFELLFPKYLTRGRNVCIITPGGGSSVNMTDLFASRGLRIPALTPDSQKKIESLLPDVNVNTKNPLDLGAMGFVVDVFMQCIKIVTDDPNIDIIVLPLWTMHLSNDEIFKKIIEIQQSTSKPILFCMPSIADSFEVAKDFDRIRKILNNNRALYFLSLRDAANSMSLFCDYSDFFKFHNNKSSK